MFVYIIVILLIVLLRNNLYEKPIGVARDRIEKKYIRILCFILILLAALRGSSVGTDTKYYLLDYESMPYYSFSYVLYKYQSFPGFYLLAKMCSFLHFPVQLLFGIVEFIYVYAIAKFIDRYSDDKLYSMLCFTVIGLFAFSLAGLKQTLSMAFVLLYYMTFQDKKYIKTVFWTILAFLCHRASLVFLLGILFYVVRNSKLFYVYLIGLTIVFLLGSSYVWSYLLSSSGDEHYIKVYREEASNYSYSTLILYGVLIIVLFLFGKEYMSQKKEESRIMLGLSVLVFAFQSLASVSAIAFRLSYYFLPFMIVACSNDFVCINNANTKQIIRFLIASLIVFFFVYSNRNGGSVVPYRFFWQEMF